MEITRQSQTGEKFKNRRQYIYRPRITGIGQMVVGLIQAIVTWVSARQRVDDVEQRLQRLEAGLIYERGQRMALRG